METKTIEERAREFCKRDYQLNIEGEQSAAEDGYINGATEQQEIDIQRAVEWLKDNVDYYLDGEEGGIYTSSLVFDFEQAMKITYSR